MSTTSRLALSESTLREQEAHARKIREVEIRAHASQIVVPTDQMEVRRHLRALGHPVTLFGEGHAERRSRLREVLASKAIDREDDSLIDGATINGKRGRGDSEAAGKGVSQGQSALVQEKEFYYPANGNLPSVRKAIADFSYVRASERLREMKKKRKLKSENSNVHEKGSDVRRDDYLKKFYRNVGQMRIISSQVGGTRALSTISLSHDNSELATGSWDSVCRIWDRSTSKCRFVLRGHTERITCVSYRPSADGTSLSTSGVADLASASVDGTAKVWGFSRDTMPMDTDEREEDGEQADVSSTAEIEPLQTLEGHKDRLGKIAWHPDGKHLITTGYDKTWRMWDVESGSEILMQQGHSRPVYGVSVHRDGSLVSTTSMSGHGIVWDLRSGKAIMKLCGHAKPVVGCDFSPQGNLLASCSVDGTVRLWDLRRHAQSLRLIAAHNHVVSSVRFSPCSGEYLVTSGYDSLVKVWSSRSFSCLGKVRGNENLAMSLSISNDEKSIVVCGSDRTWKDIELIRDD